MKKIHVFILVVICVMIGFSSGYLFRDTTTPKPEVIEQSSSFEVYEEFASNHILEIYVNTVNVNLKVLPSNNRNIRMIYRPSVEPSNYEYYIENKIMYMNVDEVEKSNSIVPSNREMIYLYLPKDTDVTLHYTSDSGFLDVSEVDLRHLLVNTKSGIVSLSKVDVALDIDVTTVSGKVILKELLFSNLVVNTNTALVSCTLPVLENEYEVHFTTSEGNVLVNEVEYKEYVKECEGNHKIEIVTRSGDIRVKMEEISENESEVNV